MNFFHSNNNHTLTSVQIKFIRWISFVSFRVNIARDFAVFSQRQIVQ